MTFSKPSIHALNKILSIVESCPDDGSRNQFIEIVNNFPIENFDIPRPLKSEIWGNENISDSNCVIGAFTLISVPHNGIDLKLKKPKGLLSSGQHLYSKEWIFAFGSHPLKDWLRKHPWLIVTDSCVQLAIAILRWKCYRGTPKESKLAKHILKELNLELFLPKQHKRTEDTNLRYYENDPTYLISAVMFYEFIIWEFLDFKYKNPSPKTFNTEDDTLAKEEDIEKAFEYIFKEKMTDVLIDELINKEGNKDSKSIALFFISFETGTAFDALRKRYYRLRKNVQISDIAACIDKIIFKRDKKIELIIEDFKTYVNILLYDLP